MKYKQVILSFFLFCCFCTKGFSQEEENAIPKNFAGLFGGIEWNTLSGLYGIDYERTIFTQNKLTVGAKASYVFPYKHGNFKILDGPSDVSSSLVMIMATGHLFTSPEKRNTGFFLHSGLGLGFNFLKSENLFKKTNLSPGFELGFGWHFPVGNHTALRWTNSIQFGSGNGGITLSKLSMGL